MNNNPEDESREKGRYEGNEKEKEEVA